MVPGLSKSINRSITWCNAGIKDVEALIKKLEGRTLSSMDETIGMDLLKKLQGYFDTMETKLMAGEEDEEETVFDALYEKCFIFLHPNSLTSYRVQCVISNSINIEY